MSLLQKSCSVLEPNTCMLEEQCVVSAWEMNTAGHSTMATDGECSVALLLYFWGCFFFPCSVSLYLNNRFSLLT